MYRPSYNEIVDTCTLNTTIPFAASDAIGAAYGGGGMPLTSQSVGNFSAVGMRLVNSHSLGASFAHAFGVLVPFDLEERNFYHWSMSCNVRVTGQVDAQPFVGLAVGSPTTVVPHVLLPGGDRSLNSSLIASGRGAFRMLDIANAITPGVTSLVFGIALFQRTAAISSIAHGMFSFTVSHFDEPDFVRQCIA